MACPFSSTMNLNENVSSTVQLLAVSLLVLTGISVAGVVFTSELPYGVVPLNSVWDSIVGVIAFGAMLLAVAGLLCIFVKRIRFAVLLVVCFWLLLFFALACINVFVERIGLRMCRDKEAEPVVSVVKSHTYQEMTLVLLDTDTDYDISSSDRHNYLRRVQEGDTCVAKVVSSGIGLRYLVGLKVKSRKPVE